MRTRRHQPRPRRRPRLLVVGVALLVALGPNTTAGAGRAGPTRRTESVTPARVSIGALTPESGDRYRYTPGRGSMVVRAPSANTGQNLREVWWSAPGALSTDQESCVTWTDFGGPIAQPGIALRVRHRAGALQAITITNNIWSGARNGWNVHLWPSRGGPSQGLPAQLVGQAALQQAFGTDVFHSPPLPWRLCGRVVGATVEFKAWSLASERIEPAWGDPDFGASFRLPPGWVYPGQAGGYVGHLRHGEEQTFGALRSRSLRPSPLARLALEARTSGSGLVRAVADSLGPT